MARAVCSRLPPLLSQRVRDIVYPRSVAQLERYSFTTRSLTGSPFTATTADFVAYPFAVHGYFNWRNVAIARAICAAGDAIIDVGANIGSETVGFSDIVGNAGVVYAFEPFLPNLELLRLNAGRTFHQNVVVMPFALSDHHAKLGFAVPAHGNSGSGYVLGPDGGGRERQPATNVVELQCTTLDAMRAQMRRPALIVVDAEGHEGAILRGAQELLAQDRPVIVLEVLEHLLSRAGTSPAQIAHQLRSFDYELFEIGRYAITEIGVGCSPPKSSDWLALPSPSDGVIERIRSTVLRSAIMPCLKPLNPLCG